MTVTFTAADGAAAECHPPFPPVRWARTGNDGDPAAAAEAIVAHAVAARTIGVLLVRLGGYAVGVFVGAPPKPDVPCAPIGISWLTLRSQMP